METIQYELCYFLYFRDMKKLILLFIAFVSLSNYSYSQEYAELSIDGINRKPTMFKGYFEYTTDIPPIQGEKCSKKVPMCDYPMTVTPCLLFFSNFLSHSSVTSEYLKPVPELC